MSWYQVPLQRSVPLRLEAHSDGPTVRTFKGWCDARLQAGARLAVDLFAGAGGLSQGIESAGWTVAASVDHDPRSVETHRHNFSGLSLDMDLSLAEQRSQLLRLFDGTPVDLVAGGPPCQPFSRAGRSKIRSLVEAGIREAHDGRKDLWQAFVETALSLRPRAILMENVPDMALGDDLFVIRLIVDRLEEAGYATDVRIVDAWKYGVPQHRKRLILLARNDGLAPSWPKESAAITTLADAIADLPRLGSSTGAREMRYQAPPQSNHFVKMVRRGAEDGLVHDHMTRPVREDDRKVFEMMTSKTLYSDLPEDLRRYKADTFNDKYKRLDWDELGRTITAHIAKDGYWYIHPSEARTLTVREAARLQTFPDRFRFSGTRSDAFRQIGNAVPPLLAQAASQALAPTTDGQPPKDWLAARKTLTTWARRQGASSQWFMFPSVGVTPPVALAAAVCSGFSNTEEVARPLEWLRGLAHLNRSVLDATIAETSSPTLRRALERLRPIAGKRAIWRDLDDVLDLVKLSASEKAVFDLLVGEDVLLKSQGPSRVVARVTGSNSNRVNRLTDGRTDLARVVGGGEEAPLRMSAIRAIADSLCRPKTTSCERCPLQQWCVANERRQRLGLTSAATPPL